VNSSVARVEALTPATVLGVDAFGPVPDVIDRARNGDRSAFAELYDTHVDSVYRYLLYRVREPADAEDLCSEVFTRAFANIHRGPTAHDRAVHGEAVDALRGAVRHLTSEQQEVLVLRFVENRSSREVAKILGKNEGAIRALQFRALGRLRKLLRDEPA